MVQPFSIVSKHPRDLRQRVGLKYGETTEAETDTDIDSRDQADGIGYAVLKHDYDCQFFSRKFRRLVAIYEKPAQELATMKAEVVFTTSPRQTRALFRN